MKSNDNKVVFHYGKTDDGCIFIEFVWSDRRACIFFEPDIDGSSWCYVEKDNPEEMNDGHILPGELLRYLKELFGK
jgi:hypothetical protein